MPLLHWLVYSTAGTILVWLVALLSWFLTFYSHWLWVLAAVPLTLFVAIRAHFYYGRPWRRIHFPMMRTYNECAAIESVLAANQGREFANINALTSVAYRHWGLSDRQDAQALVDACLRTCLSGEDQTHLPQYAASRGHDEEWVQGFKAFVAETNQRFDRGLEIKLLIAKKIQERYGLADRVEYLYTIFTEKT